LKLLKLHEIKNALPGINIYGKLWSICVSSEYFGEIWPKQNVTGVQENEMEKLYFVGTLMLTACVRKWEMSDTSHYA
jgi:hypothetical protein